MVIEKVIPLFIIFSITLFLKKKEIFQKKDGQLISKVLANMVVPAMIINAFSNVSFTQNLLVLPILGLVVVIAMLGIGYILSAALRLSGKTRGAFIISFPTLEGGTVGYVLMLAVFGQSGLVPIALFDLGNAICFFCVIFFIAYSLGHDKGTFKLTTGVSQLLKSPVIGSFLIGILMNILHIHLDAISSVVNAISPAAQLLIMVTLALEFEPSFSSLQLPILTVLLKTGIGFTLGVGITLLFHITGVEQVAIIIGTSLPSSLLTLMYSSENNLDSQYVANLLSIALPCAFLFDAALIYMLGLA